VASAHGKERRFGQFHRSCRSGQTAAEDSLRRVFLNRVGLPLGIATRDGLRPSGVLAHQSMLQHGRMELRSLIQVGILVLNFAFFLTFKFERQA